MHPCADTYMAMQMPAPLCRCHRQQSGPQLQTDASHASGAAPVPISADLPGAAALNPRKRVTSLELSMVPAVVEGPTGSNGQLLRFANSFYRNDKTEETFM